MKRLFLFGMVLTVVFIFFSACNNANDQSEFNDKFGKSFNFDEETFLSKWNSWNNQNIQNYSFILSQVFPYLKIKLIYINGILDSYENADPSSNSDSFFELLNNLISSQDFAQIPDFSSMSNLYQSIYDKVHVDKQSWNTKVPDHIISKTINLEYGAMHNISFYGISTKFKEGYKPPTDGDFPFVISEFKIEE